MKDGRKNEIKNKKTPKMFSIIEFHNRLQEMY